MRGYPHRRIVFPWKLGHTGRQSRCVYIFSFLFLLERRLIMKKKIAASLCALVLAGGITAGAEGSVYELNPIVVTATRTEIELSKAPANVSVITGEEIEERHYTDLSQVMRNVSDVYIANYGSGVGYENSNSFYINGSNNVVWMIDGVIMNTAGTNPPLHMMKNMDNIQRIEVLKGAASALYGSSAVGGVINIITKKPVDTMTSKVRVVSGSYGQEQYSFSTAGGEKGWQWRAQYQKDLMSDYKDAHGLTIPQHLNGETRSFMLGRDIGSSSNLALYYDKYDADMMYSDSNKKLNLVKKGVSDWRTWKVILTSDISDTVKNRLTYLDNRYATNYNGYFTDLTTRDLSDQFTWIGDAHTLIVGFDWRQDEVNHSGYAGAGQIQGLKLTNMSYYIQDEWKFAPSWTLTPGVRLDHHSSFGNHTSPHVALAYEFNPRTNAYASYNEFFIAPSPSNLFNATYGNPNMKPETGHSWEMGVNHQFSDTLVGNISFFTRKSKDKIGYDRTIGKYANIDEEKAHGVNANLRKMFNPYLSAHVGYTYTHVDATPQRAENVDGYVPKHAIVLGVDYNAPKWDAHLDVRGNIDRPGPQTADAALPGSSFFPKTTYWITDLSANVQVTPNVTIFGRVNNLFDVFYAEHSNARGNWGGAPNEWWTAPGRNYQLGVEVKF